MWIPYRSGTTIGQVGSEDGIIVRDEEYQSGCRITIEECPKYSAITCGIYGLMVHTVFCDREHPEATYESMKTDLQEFMEAENAEDYCSEFCEWFTDKY